MIRNQKQGRSVQQFHLISLVVVARPGALSSPLPHSLLSRNCLVELKIQRVKSLTRFCLKLENITFLWCYLNRALRFSCNCLLKITGFLSWAHFAPKLDHFRPKVRLNSPLKLGSKCWKIHTGNDRGLWILILTKAVVFIHMPSDSLKQMWQVATQ